MKKFSLVLCSMLVVGSLSLSAKDNGHGKGNQPKPPKMEHRMQPPPPGRHHMAPPPPPPARRPAIGQRVGSLYRPIKIVRGGREYFVSNGIAYRQIRTLFGVLFEVAFYM